MVPIETFLRPREDALGAFSMASGSDFRGRYGAIDHVPPTSRPRDHTRVAPRRVGAVTLSESLAG